MWDWKSHDDMADAFADIAGDRDIKVLIHTGTGENYNADWGRLPNGELPDEPLYRLRARRARAAQARREGLVRQATSSTNVLERRRTDDQRRQRAVQHPLRSAADGRHRPRVRRRVVPGRRALPPRSGARRRPARHLELPRRPQPGRYLLLTGKKLGAQEALDWGAVNEVLPKDQLLDRAWELARELVKRPPLVLRYTRQLFTQELKRAFLERARPRARPGDLRAAAFFPFGGGMTAGPAWDDQPWSD